MRIFIPIGIVFYGIANLNFVRISEVDPLIFLLIVAILIIYLVSIILMGRLLNQKREITYLTATGSAICGASAIAITSPAIDADSDDVSVSLLSVAIVATFGILLISPTLGVLLNLSSQLYAIFVGSTLQFTGFVEAAVNTMPMMDANEEIVKLALSVKAVRYLGLLFAIPLFSSLKKKKISLPWFLPVFLIAGVVGSLMCIYNPSFYYAILSPIVRPVYLVLWSISMAAIGLYTDLGKILSINGGRALIMAFASFIFATSTSLIIMPFISIGG